MPKQLQILALFSLLTLVPRMAQASENVAKPYETFTPAPHPQASITEKTQRGVDSAYATTHRATYVQPTKVVDTTSGSSYGKFIIQQNKPLILMESGLLLIVLGILDLATALWRRRKDEAYSPIE